ncbi:MAG: hypothetical protein ACYDBT_07910 [Desulfobulbaceae bacterium]
MRNIISRRWLPQVIFFQIVLLFCILSKIGNAYGEEAATILHWDFPQSTKSYIIYGPITIPSDGYLGFVIHSSEPDPDSLSHINIEVLWPYQENNCYIGNIPYAGTPSSASQSLVIDQMQAPSFSTNSIHPNTITLPELIRRQENIIPGKIYSDMKTAVPQGLILIQVTTPTTSPQIPHQLTVFWEKAYADADVEPNRVFDKPLDLGRISAPYKINSQIGFISSKDYQIDGQWACLLDSDDYFKFQVSKNGYYYFSYESLNDNWYNQISTSPLTYCMPAAGIHEEDSYGSRYIEYRWWLIDKNIIGPYYLSTDKTYYLNLQRQSYSDRDSRYECTANLIFNIQYGGYTKYNFFNFYIFTPISDDYGIAGKKLFIRHSVTNSGTIDGKPNVRINIKDQYGNLQYTREKTVTISRSLHLFDATVIEFEWDIPQNYANDGNHTAEIIISENSDIKLQHASDFVVYKNVPPVIEIIELLLLTPLLYPDQE